MKFFKKILPHLILLNLLAILFIPLTVYAQAALDVPKKCLISHDLTKINSTCSKNAEVAIDEQGTCCFINAILNVRDWLFTILLIIAAIFIIIAAFYFVTASGNPEQVTKAKHFVLYALIGVAVAAMSMGLINLIKTIVGWV